MPKPICLFHMPCADGFTAAWVVRSVFGDEFDYLGVAHGDEPPDVTDRHVAIVDFSYKRPALERMMAQAASLLVLDHHESAQRELAFLEEPPEGGYDPEGWLYAAHFYGTARPAYAIFDMERSGARLAWDYFRPGEKPPELLLHVEDRDLWRFNLPNTREIQAALFSYDYDFDTWDALVSRSLKGLYEEGRALERKHFKDIRELLKTMQRELVIGQHLVPVASLPYTLGSDAGHIMAQGKPFAACYMDTPTGRTFSLRSADDGLNVSKIAEQYGGGGHMHAAGFQVPRNHPLARD